MHGIFKTVITLSVHLMYCRSVQKYLKSIVIYALLFTPMFVLNISKEWRKSLVESDQTSKFCEIYERMTCKNGGLMEEKQGKYACKCLGDFYGIHCENEIFFNPISWLRRIFDNTDVNLRKGKPAMWWSVFPFTLDSQLRNIYEFHQNNIKRLEMFTGINGEYSGHLRRTMTSTRILPPEHPIECIYASNIYFKPLVDVQIQLVQREPGAFKPDPKRRNVLLDTFYKYFVLQFFDANFNFTVTASQLYGADEATKKKLRLFSDGKLKTEIQDDEHYSPSLSLIERILIKCRTTKFALKFLWFNGMMYSSDRIPLTNWTEGYPMSNMDPMFFVMSTLWVREHNRVCDVLRQKWPEWTDDELYNTAKRIIIGEMMAIMMNEVINVHAEHSLSLQYKPEIFHNRLQDINSFTTPFELLLTTMWPTTLPETPMKSVFFSDNKQVQKYDLSNTVKYMVNQEIGMVTHGNYGDATERATSMMMRLSRENIVQRFNNYRKKLGLNAYRSFYDLTEDMKTAKILEKLYDNVDDVEFLVGMLTEKRKQGVLSTVQIMTNSLLVNSILTNPLNGRDFWKSETFGGQEGFDMVRFANIETFVCNNLVDKCSDGFKVKLYAS